MTEADSAQLLEWRNLPEVSRWMYTDHLISQHEHDRWFRSVVMAAPERYWIIELDGEGVGLVNLSQVDEPNRRCNQAIYLGSEQSRGRGAGTFAQYRMLEYVFEELDFNKTCAQVLAGNRASIAMYEGLGFRHEGYLRQHVLKSDGPHDVVSLALLQHEWRALRPAIAERLQSKGVLPI